VASEGEGERFEVEVLHRDEVVTFPRLRQPVEVVLVTYVAGRLPPAVVEIPKAEWTLEREKEIIRTDIERRLKFKPEVYVV